MKPIYAKPPLGSRAAFQVRKDYFDYLDTRWHYHAEYELAYINYPAGKLLAGSSINAFQYQNLVFLGPNLPHAWLHDSTHDTDNLIFENYAVVVHFSGSCFGESFFSIPEMQAIGSILEKSKRGLTIHGKSKEKIISLMSKLLKYSGAQRVILLLQILEELTQSNEYRLLTSAGYWDNLNDNDAVRMGSIYEYIIQNFKNDIRLDEIASHAHMSSSAFCRYFKIRTKKTLKEFINDLRINYACQLLEENKLSITNICYEAGFNNISNFNRRFRELKKVTPQQYKAKIIRLYNGNQKIVQ